MSARPQLSNTNKMGNSFNEIDFEAFGLGVFLTFDVDSTMRNIVMAIRFAKLCTKTDKLPMSNILANIQSHNIKSVI